MLLMRPMSNEPLTKVILRGQAPTRQQGSGGEQTGIGRSASAKSEAWPVQVLTFGRFSIVPDGTPLVFCRKTPKRPVTLLKVFLAFGGRDVSEQRIEEVLWSDDEGDAAHGALAVNLHRLRRLLGDHDAVILYNGRVSLDPRRCWVDAWTFQRLLGEAALASSDHRSDLLERALLLYRGAFLACDLEEPWTLPMRERLRGTFIRHSAELGRLHEEAGRWNRAIECYTRGLEADELAEMFYQGLMRCYRHLDRRAEGIAVYRRLRRTLSVILGIAASPATEEVLKDLLSL